jgi:hypothetical protein
MRFVFISSTSLCVPGKMQECIRTGGDWFPDLAIVPLWQTVSYMYFPNMSLRPAHAGPDLYTDQDLPVQLPHPSPVHLHQRMIFLVHSPPPAISPESRPGRWFPCAVSPSSGGIGAETDDAMDELSRDVYSEVTRISGDGSYCVHAGTPDHLEMG